MSDIFKTTKDLFYLPELTIYLDGNSLGPLPKAASRVVTSMMKDEWGEMLIRGWNDAGWMEMPSMLGNRIGRLIGAPTGSVVLGDTLSIKVHQALAAALALNPHRKVILSDTGNFPTDLYMAEGLIRTLDNGHKLRLADPEEIESCLDESIAVLMLTEVDYRTGRLHDMKKLTAQARKLGIVTVWDLAHSAGALPVHLEECGVDFAIGCTYKYLNSGPGGPAFIYVASRHHDNIQPALSGWLGHEAPFAFDLDYRPGKGIERMRVGTPPVIQMTALSAALDVWDIVSIEEVRQRSVELCDLFITEIEQTCPQLVLASPRNGNKRGSQVSFRFENGYAAMQAIIKRGVIGDFRAPDIMRFGFTPLYIDHDDVRRAATIIADVMQHKLWDRPEFHQCKAIT